MVMLQGDDFEVWLIARCKSCIALGPCIMMRQALVQWGCARTTVCNCQREHCRVAAGFPTQAPFGLIITKNACLQHQEWTSNTHTCSNAHAIHDIKICCNTAQGLSTIACSRATAWAGGLRGIGKGAWGRGFRWNRGMLQARERRHTIVFRL